MKSLKEKFGKFEMSKEETKKVKGGVVAVCTLPGGAQELIAGDTVDDVQNFANELGYDDCTFV